MRLQEELSAALYDLAGGRQQGVLQNRSENLSFAFFNCLFL
jgi:hypothetical protein